MSREKDLKRQIATHQRRLQNLKERHAMLGISTDPDLLIEIEDVEATLAELEARLDKKAISTSDSISVSESATASIQDQKLKNPYTFGVPVRGEGKFFGREEELRLIFDTLENVPRGQKQDMVVLGPRRIGKSSLLYRLVDLLTPSADFTPVYVDVQNVKPREVRILFLEILQNINEGYQQKNLLAQLFHFATLEADSIPSDLEFYTFKRDMIRLNNVIVAQNLPRLVLMFDEVELLTEFGGISTLEWFRGLIQSLGYCIFVVAGSDRLYELTLDYTSPFYNIFKTIEVRALSIEAATSLITEPAATVGLTYPASEVDRILYYTGKNPYFIQAMGHYLIELLNQNKRVAIQAGDADRIAPQLSDHLSAQFNYFWGSFNAVERGLLYLLAHKEKPQTASALVEDFLDLTNIHLSEREQRAVFVKLSHQQAIEPIKESKDPQYRFVVQLFANWIRAKIKSDEILDRLRQEEMVTTTETIDQNYEHLKKLLSIYRRNLYQLEERGARYGPLYIPISLANEIEATKSKISELEESLRRVATKE